MPLLKSRFMLALFCTLATPTQAQVKNSLTTPFPDDFLFGTAIAGFQVDMGCPTLAPALCNDTNSDWFQWTADAAINKDPKLYMSGQSPLKGPGFVELYQQDVDNASQVLHNNSLRLSLEWSRIFPQSTVGVIRFEDLKAMASPDALNFYHQLFASMKAAGLKPMVTVNHYSLPLWIHDGVGCHNNLKKCSPRGWLDHDLIIREISKYAGFVAREFGGEVDLWATLNEPFTAVVLPSYLIPGASRVNPPGLSYKINEAKAATLTMIEAHARMYDAIKANDAVDADGDGDNAQVGLVYAVTATAAASASKNDQKAAANAKYLFNDLFLQGVAQGVVDAKWNGKTIVREDLQNRLDFLGVNYYFQLTVKDGGLFNLGRLISSKLTFDMNNIPSNPAYPLGLYESLIDMKKYGKPLYVTETGVDTVGSPMEAKEWLVKTLAYTRQAMLEGVDVRSYFYWSLMDNFEWNHGMNMKFGLFAVDPNDPSKTRVPKAAAATFGEIGLQGALSEELLQGYSWP